MRPSIRFGLVVASMLALLGAPGASADTLPPTLTVATNLRVLTEEYRAFYAEKLLSGRAPGAAECKRLKEQVIHDYELKGVTGE